MLTLQLQRYIYDHVFLTADVASLTNSLQDRVCGYVVALGSALRVEQE